MDAGGETLTSNGFMGAFLEKAYKNGDFLWQKTMGSPQEDVYYAIGLNRTNENVVAVGTFASAFARDSQCITSRGSYDSSISFVKQPC